MINGTGRFYGLDMPHGIVIVSAIVVRNPLANNR